MNSPNTFPDAATSLRYPPEDSPVAPNGALLPQPPSTTMSSQPNHSLHPSQSAPAHPPFPPTENHAFSVQSQLVPNMTVFAQDPHAAVPMPPAQFPPPAPTSGQTEYGPTFSASTQQLLKRLGASQNVSAGTPEWEAARKQVMKSMANTWNAHAPNPFPSARGSARGPRGGAAPAGHIETAEIADSTAMHTPTGKRGPGRPRGRGGRPRGSGRSGKARKRKRARSDDEQVSKSESDESISYSPNFTVTKSGRNVNKPSQFNPAPQPATPSTSGGGHRGRRSYRRGPEFALCAKCARGHSPISNPVVFCDGCNAAYHQWCHDPPIGREVIEVETASWFCAKCSSQKELDECPLDKRLSSEQINLTPDERMLYLNTLSAPTLAQIVLRASVMHPDIPVYAPDAKAISQKSAQSSGRQLALFAMPKTSSNQQNGVENNQKAEVKPTKEEDPSESYADYDNAANDPPATFPRPGNGPMKPTATTNPEDMHWLLDDSFEAFSHFYYDKGGSSMANGRSDAVAANIHMNLVPIQGDGKGGWIQREGVSNGTGGDDG